MIYYPAAKVRLSIVMRNPDAPEFPLFLPEGWGEGIPDFVRYPLSRAGEAAEAGLSYLTGLSEPVIEIEALPSEAVWTVRDYSEPDELEVAIEYDRLPFDPRLAKAINITLWIVNRESNDRPAVYTDADRVFTGICDLSRLAGGDSRMCRLRALDYSALLRNQPWTGAQVDWSRPVDDVVRDLLSLTPFGRALGVEYRGGAYAPDVRSAEPEPEIIPPAPLPAMTDESVMSGTLPLEAVGGITLPDGGLVAPSADSAPAPGKGKGAETQRGSFPASAKVWDVITRTAAEAGMIVWFEGDRLVISESRDQEGPVPVFEYGLNVTDFDVESRMGGFRNPVVEVSSWDRDAKKTRYATYPAALPAETDGTGVPVSSTPVRHYVDDVKDEAVLLEIARRIYQRYETVNVSVELETGEMDVGGVALRSLKPGNRIEFYISKAERDLMHAKTQTERFRLLTARGIGEQQAMIISAAYGDIRASYRVIESRHSYSIESGYSARIISGGVL